MNTEKRKLYNLKQLNIEVPADIMERIKFNAERRNIRRRTWILRAIISALSVEDKG